MNGNKHIESLIALAINEDIGDGDHTSLACLPPHKEGKVKLLVKEDGVLSGMEIARMIIRKIDPQLEFVPLLKNGDKIQVGDIAFTLSGQLTSILQAERLLLNFMQRMSGIATQTAFYTSLVKDLPTQILDTRKTTPGLRFIEKIAVKHGGGANHRMGLYDMVMIKDNHIDFAGGIEPAIGKVREYLRQKSKNLRIEIEVRNLEELKEVLRVGQVHRIMLDNFSIEDTKTAVKMIGGEYETESSGGITEKNLRSYAECGVDYISVGALTHHIRSLDLSLKPV
ncbi:MAG: nicotinate-nucleotide diphosphorylase (carboxylating) [Bacteroidia bacterium]|nr:MAG: nicotinate-nucleotide diphosphorylase (carboxylating) [Bacteroidia bacterium]